MEDNYSMPRWMYAVIAAALLGVSIAAIIIHRRAGEQLQGRSAVPTTRPGPARHPEPATRAKSHTGPEITGLGVNVEDFKSFFKDFTFTTTVSERGVRAIEGIDRGGVARLWVLTQGDQVYAVQLHVHVPARSLESLRFTEPHRGAPTTKLTNAEKSEIIRRVLSFSQEEHLVAFYVLGVTHQVFKALDRDSEPAMDWFMANNIKAFDEPGQGCEKVSDGMFLLMRGKDGILHLEVLPAGDDDLIRQARNRRL